MNWVNQLYWVNHLCVIYGPAERVILCIEQSIFWVELYNYEWLIYGLNIGY